VLVGDAFALLGISFRGAFFFERNEKNVRFFILSPMLGFGAPDPKAR
jgi:uncharacterized integral membrane protein